MSKRISQEDVAHVARLARLEITADELATFTEQLGIVLDTAADLAALDLADVEPMAQPCALENVTRLDVIEPSLDRDQVLAMAPAAEDGRFRVPPALGEPT